MFQVGSDVVPDIVNRKAQSEMHFRFKIDIAAEPLIT